MDVMILPLAVLNESQMAAVRRLPACCFPGEPRDLFEVKLVRAQDPRIGVGLVACMDGWPVGALLGGTPQPGRLFIAYLVLAAGHRRGGLARRLLNNAVLMAGTDELEMLVNDDNLAAQRLYTEGGPAASDSPAPGGAHDRHHQRPRRARPSRPPFRPV